MAIPAIPRLKTKQFQPGLEIEHEVALSGVGVTVVECTLAVSTARTAAELVAPAHAPLNDATGNCFGAVIHSLGTAPTAVIPMVAGNVEMIAGAAMTGGITFQYLTANNTAVYVWANSWTSGATLLGVATRFVCIR